MFLSGIGYGIFSGCYFNPYLVSILPKGSESKYREPTIGPAGEEEKEIYIEFEDNISTGTSVGSQFSTSMYCRPLRVCERSRKFTDVNELETHGEDCQEKKTALSACTQASSYSPHCQPPENTTLLVWRLNAGSNKCCEEW